MKTLLLLLLGCASAAFAQNSTNTFQGSWQWHFTMPDGTETRPKLRLKQDGGKITGTSSHRSGTDTAITNVMVKGDELRFEVIRERNGTATITRYHGQRDGDVIRGKVESNWSGAFTSYDWEARRTSGIEGTWKWSSPGFGGRSFENRVKLKFDGNELTGSMPSFGRGGGRETPIKNGTFKDGEIYFEIERGRDDFKWVQIYEGKLKGDLIEGTVDFEINGEPVTQDWDAQRAD